MQTWLSPHCSLELQILLQIPFLQTSLGKQSWFELTHFEAQTPSEQRLPAPHCKLFLQAFIGISQLANGSPVIPGGQLQNGLWFCVIQMALTPH